jgi:hypothetical protein
MGFQVNPHAVSAYADVLRKQAEHHDAALKYVETHIDVGVSSGDGLITTAEEFNPKIVESVRHAIKDARSFFEESSDALQATADYYTKTDYENAKKLDDTYKGGEDVDVVTPGPKAVDHPAEVADPTDALKTPGTPKAFDKGPIVDTAKWINDATSPATYIRLLVKEINNDRDPFDEVIKEFSGDWEAFAKASKACEHLSEFYTAVYANLWQIERLAYHWRGHASDHAMGFFATAGRNILNTDFAKLTNTGPCTEENPEGTWVSGEKWGYVLDLTELGEGYLTLAKDVSEFADAANNALNAIIDTLSWSILAAGAGAVTSWSGVGLITGEMAAALLMGKTLTHITDYTTAIGNVSSAIDSFSMLDATGGPASSLENSGMPKPYRTPEGM